MRGWAVVVAASLASVGAAAAVDGCSGQTFIASDAGASDGNAAGDDAGASLSCGAGTKACGAECIAADNPSYGCASSDCHACPLGGYATAGACIDGGCAITTCEQERLDCNHDPADGCEVSRSGDPSNCGGCNVRCDGGLVCSSGACAATCAAGLENCGGACVMLDASAANCGACGKTCPAVANATSTCTSGQCGYACTFGRADCDKSGTNGCECDLGVARCSNGKCCTNLGESCTTNAECCSGQACNGTCCKQSGSTCYGSYECCSGRCNTSWGNWGGGGGQCE